MGHASFMLRDGGHRPFRPGQRQAGHEFGIAGITESDVEPIFLRLSHDGWIEVDAEHRMTLLKDARFLLSLREELKAEEERLASHRMDLARRYLEDDKRPDRPEAPARAYEEGP